MQSCYSSKFPLLVTPIAQKQCSGCFQVFAVYLCHCGFCWVLVFCPQLLHCQNSAHFQNWLSSHSVNLSSKTSQLTYHFQQFYYCYLQWLKILIFSVYMQDNSTHLQKEKTYLLSTVGSKACHGQYMQKWTTVQPCCMNLTGMKAFLKTTLSAILQPNLINLHSTWGS